MSNPLADQEVTRLTEFLTAISQHGWTIWPDSSCGTGRPGGQMLTTEYHGEVLGHLVSAAFMGVTLKEAANQWEQFVPGSSRLDLPPKSPRRRGPDGRPV